MLFYVMFCYAYATNLYIAATILHIFCCIVLITLDYLLLININIINYFY